MTETPTLFVCHGDERGPRMHPYRRVQERLRAAVGIDRARYFERCWPNAERIGSYEFRRLVENGDEVVVTYDATRADGHRFRNTEVLTLAGDKIGKAEVYFGWDLD